MRPVWARLASEVAYLRGSLRVLKRIGPIARQPGHTIVDEMEETCARFADRVAIISDRGTLTYRDFAENCRRHARWARAQGLGKGDTVALMMGNCADYLCIWMGVAMAGAATALINTNLSGQALAHSISIVQAKAVIVSAEHLATYIAARPFVTSGAALWTAGTEHAEGTPFGPAVAAFDGAPLAPEERTSLTIEDRCVFIYTSGTTGLPKAANINHYRILAMSRGFSAIMDAQPDDRMYDCLPMYHSNGGVLATWGVLVRGGSVVIRDKFSAREFWNEIVRYQCTLFFYIGELCRYLVNSSPGPNDRAHRIRLVCGNGLRPDIWETFVERFGIRQIREFYAATEGNIALFNMDSRTGSVGRIPKWAERRFIVKIVRFDIEREEPIRNPDGFCIPCAPGEVGEVVGQILNDPRKPANRFEGYADRAATERKILRDCFEKGDAWFRSGDLMRRDRDGYFYFVDRIGDTYRWKGENVATSQVSEAITVYPGVADCTVYGVAVPGCEGRAGMAAIVVAADEPFDLQELRNELVKHLPDYARPVFLRMRPALDLTGTFKQRKVDLVREGADPAGTADPIYFDHPGQRRFVRLDDALWRQITTGSIRL